MITYKDLRENSATNGFLKKFPDVKAIQNNLRKFGAFMAGMIMPVIGVIIAWGFFTAIVLAAQTIIMQTKGITKWEAIHSSTYLWNMDWIISFGISSVIPIMVGFFAGKQIHDFKGAAIGVIATMGVIGGSYNPLFNDIMVQITGDIALTNLPPPVMILGAMIAAPIAAMVFKKLEKLWINRIPSGFEMLFNNLSVGLIGLAFMFISFWSIALLAAVLQSIFYIIINGLNRHQLLWLMPMFIETEKILFLNNAVNHGILGPLGYQQVADVGQSALFYLDPNPGSGMGLLLAYFLFGTKSDKAQSAAAMPVQFIGGIHEVYFPFVLTKPLNLVWLIAGGTFAAGMYQVFDVGGLFTPSPGSVIMNYLALKPEPLNYGGLTLAIFGSLAITCSLTSIMLISERLARNERVYFNPRIALEMAKANRLMNMQEAVSINKTKPIAQINYEDKPTSKAYEWEIIGYQDGSIENFINNNKNKKIIDFQYFDINRQQLKEIKEKIKQKSFDFKESIISTNNKNKTYLIRKFSNDKISIIRIRKTEKIMNSVNYEDRTLVDKTRTIIFKPYFDKKNKEKQYKPLIQKVWYLNPEEKISDFEIKKNSKIIEKDISLNEEPNFHLLKNASKILFACEAGMGSSAMGAGIVRKMLKDENIKNILVMNYAIKDLPPNAEVIIVQNIFKDLVVSKFPNAYVYTIEQFLKKQDYKSLIDNLINIQGEKNDN